MAKRQKCDLCGSDDGQKYSPVTVPKYGEITDIVIAAVPHACEAICERCKTILNKYTLQKELMRSRRETVRHNEYERRKKNGLCMKCGGDMKTSEPVMVYEGCYEITRTCMQCGNTESWT